MIPPEIEGLLMKTAAQSDCARLKVGAAIFKDGMLVAKGANVSASPCDNETCTVNGSCKRKTHAEITALMACARDGISTKDAVIYVTALPCPGCMQAIKAAGIKKVFYKHYYAHHYKNNDHEGLELIQA